MGRAAGAGTRRRGSVHARSRYHARMEQAETRTEVARARSESEETARMAAEVREGLTATPLRRLPCKYFYDDRGCALYEKIVALPEYYPSRTEESILDSGAEFELLIAGRSACRPWVYRRRRLLAEWQRSSARSRQERVAPSTGRTRR